jgi:hypothetical protein
MKKILMIALVAALLNVSLAPRSHAFMAVPGLLPLIPIQLLIALFVSQQKPELYPLTVTADATEMAKLLYSISEGVDESYAVRMKNTYVWPYMKGYTISSVMRNKFTHYLLESQETYEARKAKFYQENAQVIEDLNTLERIMKAVLGKERVIAAYGPAVFENGAPNDKHYQAIASDCGTLFANYELIMKHLESQPLPPNPFAQ